MARDKARLPNDQGGTSRGLTVHAVELDKATGGSDTRSLTWVRRLVVVRHGLGLALVSKN